METMETKVKEWYTATYNFDELGAYIDDYLTFADVFAALKNRGNIHKIIGVNDGFIRERIFVKLAKIADCSYNWLHDLWFSASPYYDNPANPYYTNINI